MSEQQVQVVIYKDADSDQWVAGCLEYDVTTQGDSEEHAKAMIKEAVELHLEDLDSEELDILYQAIEGEPRVHEVSVNAPVVTPQLRLRALEHIGVHFERQRGSHTRYRGRWRRQERNVTLVAGQEVIPARMLANILDQAGIAPKEFDRLVKGETIRE